MKPIEIYVDYALHSKVGIHCDNPFMRIQFKPTEKVQYQIEGETLAVKRGVYYFIKKMVNNKNLIIYTDNKTLLNPFVSKTNAGKWWKDAWNLAQKNDINLTLKFVRGVDNPADILTRDENKPKYTKEQKAEFFRQQWLNKNTKQDAEIKLPKKSFEEKNFIQK